MKVVLFRQPDLFIIRWLSCLLITIEGIILICTFGIVELEVSGWAQDKLHRAICNLQRRAPFEYGVFDNRRKG